MIRNVIKMGHPHLMQPAARVEADEFNTPELEAMIQDMIDTLKDSKGVGIAANQVDITKRIVVIGFEDNSRYPDEKPIPITALINPMFTPISDEMAEGWEGCLSIPGLRGWVPRYTKIYYEYQDITGKRHAVNAEGFEARVIQHECDHLDGVVFPARIQDFRQFGFEDSLPEFVEKFSKNNYSEQAA